MQRWLKEMIVAKNIKIFMVFKSPLEGAMADKNIPSFTISQD